MQHIHQFKRKILPINLKIHLNGLLLQKRLKEVFVTNAVLVCFLKDMEVKLYLYLLDYLKTQQN